MPDQLDVRWGNFITLIRGADSANTSNCLRILARRSQKSSYGEKLPDKISSCSQVNYPRGPSWKTRRAAATFSGGPRANLFLAGSDHMSRVSVVYSSSRRVTSLSLSLSLSLYLSCCRFSLARSVMDDIIETRDDVRGETREISSFVSSNLVLGSWWLEKYENETCESRLFITRRLHRRYFFFFFWNQRDCCETDFCYVTLWKFFRGFFYN